jgi:hypothetical protein
MHAAQSVTGVPAASRLRTAAVTLMLALAACGGGGEGGPPPPATVSTLAYVVSRCHADANGGTLQQSLQIRRGDQPPITVVEHSVAGFDPKFTDAKTLCSRIGADRRSTSMTVVGVFHRLGVTADGLQVVFEVTDDQPWTVFPPHGLPDEQRGIFVVGADGGGLRRLGPASSEPPYRSNGFSQQYTWPWFASSPNSRMVTYTDRGPSLDNEDAIQISTLDLVTGIPFLVTRLPPAPGPVTPCGSTGCPVFQDDRTISFLTHANLDGNNLDAQNVGVTVKTDGTELTPSPPIAALPGSELQTTFQITGSGVSVALLTLQGSPVNGRFSDKIQEVFVTDGHNLLQLTNFRRIDTFRPTVSADGQRVFFSASPNPLGTNPTENCQVFSIDRNGGDLRQLTDFQEAPEHSSAGCFFRPPPSGCLALLFGRDLHSDALVLHSTCDPFGTNRYGSQVFVMRQDGTGLRQITETQGYSTDASGAVTVELPFPTAFPGTLQ